MSLIHWPKLPFYSHLQGHLVVSGDNHGMISVFDKDTGESIQTLPLAHSKAVLSVSMSADGTTVASVGADNKVRLQPLG